MHRSAAVPPRGPLVERAKPPPQQAGPGGGQFHHGSTGTAGQAGPFTPGEALARQEGKGTPRCSRLLGPRPAPPARPERDASTCGQRCPGETQPHWPCRFLAWPGLAFRRSVMPLFGDSRRRPPGREGRAAVPRLSLGGLGRPWQCRLHREHSRPRPLPSRYTHLITRPAPPRQRDAHCQAALRHPLASRRGSAGRGVVKRGGARNGVPSHLAQARPKPGR